MSSEDPLSKRDEKKLMRDLKIITAISMGKDRNKELAKVLDTDKSYTAKRVKELEDLGLVKREGIGKETRYRVNEFNVLRFLQSKVVIRWKRETEEEESQEPEENTK